MITAWVWYNTYSVGGWPQPLERREIKMSNFPTIENKIGMVAGVIENAEVVEKTVTVGMIAYELDISYTEASNWHKLWQGRNKF